MAIAAPTDFLVTVRTGSGDLRLTNRGLSTLNLAAYSITFPSADLRANEWLPIAGRLDASGDQSVDADDDWLILSPQPLPTLVNNLSEGEFNGDGGFLQPGDSIYLGGVWNPSTSSSSLNFEVVEVQGGNSVASFLDITFLPAGDNNEDGVVDAADFTLWRESIGQTGAGLLADGDGNGVIDVGDYIVWKAYYGLTSFVIPAPGAAALSISAVVPEPSAVVILLGLGTLIGCALCLGRSKCSR
ncbi:MAG: hypothetical protein ACR2NU_15605 [Aeoliella sp.]